MTPPKKKDASEVSGHSVRIFVN